jgi:hypothetical protein
MNFHHQQSFPHPFASNNPYMAFQSQMPALQNYQQIIQQFYRTQQDVIALLKLKEQFNSQLMNMKLGQCSKPQTSPISLTPKVQVYSPTEAESLSPLSSIKEESASQLELPNDPDICFEAQIKYMVQFFVNNYGKKSEEEIKEERSKYAQNPKLLLVFDELVVKYGSTNKTKEELVKWVLRKAMKVTKKAIKGGKKVAQKTLSNDLCKRYFRENINLDEENEEVDEISGSLLPFRKNSKNKTMNAAFIAEIFSSSEFREDYEIFLQDFNEISDKENVDKTPKFVTFIIQCVKKNKISDIGKYKRIPWLMLWIHNAKKVAFELKEVHNESEASKKVKYEF